MKCRKKLRPVLRPGVLGPRRGSALLPKLSVLLGPFVREMSATLMREAMRRRDAGLLARRQGYPCQRVLDSSLGQRGRGALVPPEVQA